MDMPSGIIMLWSGAIGGIPDGWFLCDGNNGTPDLRNSFIVGAGDSYSIDDSGGSNTHTHTFTADGHFHRLNTAPNPVIADTANFKDSTTTDPISGTTDSVSNVPPYYALAYIMKG